jgi:DNA-binding response OmpR family regulator
MPLSYILVVDDETTVREFLSRCLENCGYASRQAAGADEALDLMTAEPASAVLCDIRMPGHDGLWLAERLREGWPQVPVVMITAIDDVQTVRRGRELGAVEYISKPIAPEQLRQIVRRVMATAPTGEPAMTEESGFPAADPSAPQESSVDAEYTLESPVRCPACGERIVSLKAVRLIRAQVNFTSMLPRRGRVMACPNCLAVIPAELTNF